MPVTSRGKLDRKRLPPPPADLGMGEGDFVPCESRTEKVIEGVWQELLGYDDTPISALGDFVALGGNSLLAGRATTRLRLELGLKSLPGTAMYMHPTIQALAVFADSMPKLSKKASGKAPTADDARRAFKGYSSTANATVIAGQAGVALWALSLNQLGGLPTHVVVWAVYQRGGALAAAFLGLPFATLMTMVYLCAIAIIANQLLAPDVPATFVLKIPLWSAKYLSWLSAKHATRFAAKCLATYLAGTPALGTFYGLCGATVGDDAVLDSGVEVEDPKFVTLGAHSRARACARVAPHFVDCGELVLAPVGLGAGARLEPRSSLGAGGVVPDDHKLDGLSSVGGAALESPVDDVLPLKAKTPRARRTTLRVSQYLVGVPLLLLLEGCATFAALKACEGLVALVDPATRTYSQIAVVAVAVVWVARVFQCETFFVLTVLAKKVFVGSFEPGPRDPADTADCFRRWLLDRLVHHPFFCGATEPYVNTELLSAKFRMLGAKIGSRVNIDFFDCVEFDLISVGDEVVFGSCVVLHPSDEEEDAMIVVEEGANVLDHSTLLGGVVVEKRAVTGTCAFRAGRKRVIQVRCVPRAIVPEKGSTLRKGYDRSSKNQPKRVGNGRERSF